MLTNNYRKHVSLDNLMVGLAMVACFCVWTWGNCDKGCDGLLLRFVVNRMIQLVPLLIAISMLSFIIIQLPPGDFLTTHINQLRQSGVVLSEGTIQALERRYGLDRPVYEQYFIWMRNIILDGDMGTSFLWNRPVSEVLGETIGYSILLSFLTLIFVWLVGIPIGIYSATKQYSVLDYLFSFFAFIGLAVPGFLLALFIIYQVFVHTGVVISGLFSREYLEAPWSFARFMNMLPRLSLAVFLIGMPSLASLTRTTRAMLLDELQKQYVITARAKGLEERRILFKYPARMAINPMISTIGWTIPALISGEIIISIVLNLQTTGPMLRRALASQDMYLAGSFLLIVGVLTVIGTLISDILLAILDPRIRFGGGSD